jgi:hypothetical protein
LYADHTYWISLEIAFEFWEHVHKTFPVTKKGDLDQYVPPKPYAQFKEELRRGGATDFMTQHLHAGEACEFLLTFLEGDSSVEEVARQLVVEAFTDSRVVVGELRFFGLGESETWNASRGAHELMMSLSRLLLPDVSNLPVEAIMDIRDRLQDSLDPVRAELLRLTEDLQLIVSKNQNKDSIFAESDNLIATRVEPIVRDASRRANELLDRKWRRLLGGAAKAFGFAGAAFADPKLFAKAIQQTLETGALAFGKVDEDRTNFKATSQFVLHARRLASGSDE